MNLNQQTITWAILWIFNCCNLCLCLNNFHQELFGSGEFRWQDKQDIKTSKYQSSSVEDLINLFVAEKEAVIFLNQAKSKLKDDQTEVIDQFLDLIDYDVEKETKKYVYHPINAFHLLQRTAIWIPRLTKVIPEFEFKFNLPKISDAYVGAALGLADIHEHYNINTMDLADGRIKDYNSAGKFYESNSPLTSMELIKISEEAKNVLHMDGAVNWLSAALEKAREEEQDSKFISSIKKKRKIAKQDHDWHFRNFNLATFAYPNPNVTNDHMIKINEIPYYRNSKSHILEDQRNSRILDFNTVHANLFKDNNNWQGNDLMPRMQFFYRRRIQKLCKNKYNQGAFLIKDLKCIWAHHGNPYVRLGPFKYEILHENPEIAYIHDLISLNESLKVQEGAIGKMKTTPYSVGDKETSFSKGRTSKVMYMNEKRWPEAMVISKKIQMATRFKLYHERYASENFQVMNYGIGGKISGHADSQGINEESVTEQEGMTITKTSSENLKFGGVRFVTFMIYLTSVEAGGHTIFPQAGISAKPVMGSALFWYNSGAQDNADSRVFHLGCPVLYGNKWIANKWVKFVPQFKDYPCLIEKKYFSTNLVS